MRYKYQHAILGGTFDHFHSGHAKFINSALLESQHITIGLTQDPLLVKKSYPHSIEPYLIRKNNLTRFLTTRNGSKRTKIIPLTDIYGTSLTDPSIEAIYVTQSTYANGLHLSHKRIAHGLSQIEVVLVGYFEGDDKQIVSSQRIRAGLIDRTGHSYLKYFLQKPIYRLPPNLRTKLQTPLGTILTNLSDLSSIIPPSSTLISVGDVVSTSLVKAGLSPTICIIDHRSLRQKLDLDEVHKSFPTSHFTLKNPAGTINTKIGEILLSSLSQNQSTIVIKVDGEEDLLALPALLLAPLDSYIIYGQYNVGMCIVKVTEDIKSIAQNLLNQFV